MSFRSCLAPHGEIPTARLIHRALTTATLAQLEQIESQLSSGITNGTLDGLGKGALNKVRKQLCKRKFEAVFKS